MAQIPVVTPLPEQTGATAVLLADEHLAILNDENCTLTLRAALLSDWQPTTKQTFYPIERGPCTWLRASVTTPGGPADPGSDWVTEVGFHGRSTLWLLRADSLVGRYEMGNDLALDSRAYPHIFSTANQNVALVTLQPATTYQLVVKYANPYGASLYGTNDLLAITLTPAAAHDADARLHLVLSGIMVGGMLLLLLYQAAQWTVYRTELDATYCGMLLGLLSFVCYDDYLFHAALPDRVVQERWLYLTGALGLLGFFRFAQLTLRAVDHNPRRDRLLGWLVRAKAIEAPAFLLIVSFERAGPPWLRALAAAIPETFRITLIATLLIFSYAVFMHFRANRDKPTWAFLFGNLSLVAGVLLVALRSYLIPFGDFAPVRWYLRAVGPAFNYIIEIGIVGMALFFAFAVALLTKDREALIERRYNRRLAEVRMEALRSQMNPHFLFNGLNSIKLFVIDNQPRLAGDYLSRFARLIRLVLENSKSSLISLSRELETLELYIRMEALRFGGRFTYEVYVEPGVDQDFVFLPPMVLQPYVENAIWHGLLHREGDGGHLSIRVTTAGRDRLRLVIEDNGVGRDHGVKADTHTSGHRSLGMQITAERIAMLRQLYGFEASVEVIDMHDERGAPTGTRVQILLRPGSRPLDDLTTSAEAGSATYAST